eukprot:scaffold133488_cov39-Cyclotella_meneghiniana.AAC.2
MLCFNHLDSDRNNSDNLQQYVVVEFPDSMIPENQKLIPNMPTWVPIPLGMTVGQGKPFTKVVVYLPPSGNKCPGLELVATLLRIGNTNAYKARKEFLQQTQARSEPSQEFIKLAITALDPAVDHDMTFEGGCSAYPDFCGRTLRSNYYFC